MRPSCTPWATVVIVALCAVASTPAESGEPGQGSITVVYNHEGSSELVQRGGYSVYAQLGGSSVLFDVGGEASGMGENLERLGLAGTGLDAVVISHNHWDHVYGLPGVTSLTRGASPLYVPGSAAVGLKQQFPRARVVAVTAPMQIALGVWLTGPMDTVFMDAPLSEQALVLDHPAGLHVLVGCSHPGIVAIVERVKELFPDRPIALVAGGFHLRSSDEDEIRRIASDLQRLGVRKIGPGHCSGEPAVRIFRSRWAERFVRLNLGDTYRF